MSGVLREVRRCSCASSGEMSRRFGIGDILVVVAVDIPGRRETLRQAASALAVGARAGQWVEGVFRNIIARQVLLSLAPGTRR